MTEVGIEDAIGFGWAEGDGFAGKSLADLDGMPEQRGCAFLLDFADLVAGRVFERLDGKRMFDQSQSVGTRRSHSPPRP